MKLSIIVTHYNTPELLQLCLKSLKAAAADLSHEILVLDSQSRDETAEMIKSDWPEARFFPFKENTGYAKIVNVGLREAKGDYLIVLNADLMPEKDSLSKMLDYLSANPGVGLLGPQLLNFNGTVQDSCFRFHRPVTILYRRTFWGRTEAGARELARFVMKDVDKRSIQEADWLLGAALMLRREALKDVGPMDERFFLYFEDTDWCRRFREKGWRVIYFPDARMHHYHARLSKKTSGLADLFFNKYTWIHIASAVKYFWKYRARKLVSKA